MEKRSRKRSRKASETREDASEEPSSPPPSKSTRRSSGGGEESKKGRAGGRSSSRRKGLRVSFDIVENQLNVGEGEGVNNCDQSCDNLLADDAPLAATTSEERSSRTGKDVATPHNNKPKAVDVKFKNPKFTFSYLTGNRKKSWRGFKQIVSSERALQWKPTDPTFSSLDAPPPLKPAKKYSDLSGLEGKYRDPLSGLLYHSSEEFRTIRSLPPDIVTGYLALRGKQPIM